MRVEGAVQEFWGHVATLRNHLLLGGGVFIAAWGVIFAYGSATLLHYLLLPLDGQQIVFLSPLGPFFFTLKVSLYAACAACLPLWLGLALHFIFPALSPRRRLVSVGFVAASLLLTAVSLIVSYWYLIPTTFTFLVTFVVPQSSLLLSADSYIDFFLLEFTVALVILQIPLVIVLLAYVRLFNPNILVKRRRFLYVGMVALLAVLTPTTDAFTLTVVSVPAIAIAEVGIWIARRIYGNPQLTQGL